MGVQTGSQETKIQVVLKGKKVAESIDMNDRTLDHHDISKPDNTIGQRRPRTEPMEGPIQGPERQSHDLREDRPSTRQWLAGLGWAEQWSDLPLSLRMRTDQGMDDLQL